MATTIIGVGIGFIIAALAIHPGSVALHEFSILPLIAAAGMLIGILLISA